MQLTTLRLRNYRVFAELDLEIPPGLVGIYGANGAGKSSMLESITWALYGRARTSKGEIRTSGSTGECIVELGFEHDNDHYLVRRSISGVNATVKARVEVGGQVVADGPAEVGKYLRSTLGMDEQAFRSSVFAEQKQLAAFSDNTPETRKKLILQLLGIMPLDKARDAARADARTRRTDHERLLALLPALEAKEAEVVRCEADRREADAEVTRCKAGQEQRRKALAEAEARLVDERERKQTYDRLVERGREVRRRRDESAEHHDRLSAELRKLDEAQDELDELERTRPADSAEELTARAGLLTDVRRALVELHGTPLPEAPVVVDPSALEAAQRELSGVTAERATLEGELRSATRTLAERESAFAKLNDLGGASSCPLCGQELAEGFAAVHRHRTEERDASLAEVTRFRRDVEVLVGRGKTLETTVRRLEAEQRRAMDAAEKQRAMGAARLRAEERLATAVTAAGFVVPAGTGQPSSSSAPSPEHVWAGIESQVRTELAALESTIVRVQESARRRERLLGMLQQRTRLAAELSDTAAKREAAEQERSTLLGEIQRLAFDTQRFEALRGESDTARVEAERSADALRAAELRHARTDQAVVAAIDARNQALQQHQQAQTLAEESRYLGKTADFLNGFRQSVVGSIGPRLSADASVLFNELTANEYDGLEVDPETYEIRILDAGVAYPSTRFSGSEVDLANLALRVAVSEQVRFQAGGQVGLLVLDEALASLDGDRKDRMLGALTRLSGRFRQILVVTHSPEVKERLPQAIEVRKALGRRATASVVDLPVG